MTTTVNHPAFEQCNKQNSAKHASFHRSPHMRVNDVRYGIYQGCQNYLFSIQKKTLKEQLAQKNKIK